MPCESIQAWALILSFSKAPVRSLAVPMLPSRSPHPEFDAEGIAR